jgi:HAD superfamily hydrolase (TIGR01509 family)
MDGVLVDSEPLDFKACNILLGQEGETPLTAQENQIYLLGTTVEETWRRIKDLRQLPQSLTYYMERYDPIVRQLLSDDLEPQPGVTRLLEELRQRHMKSAVASSSLRSWVDLKLQVLGLQHSFDLVIGGDEVSPGKPAPDIYLLAARGLELTPEKCIAIEDSPVGIEAAVTAGTYVVAVRTSSTQGMDISKAHVILDTLETFDLSLLG